MSKPSRMYHRLLLCLLACSTPALADEPVLELWHAQQSGYVLEQSGYVIDEVIARFNRQSGHQIQLVQRETRKIKADLLLAAQTKGLPELMLVPSDFLGLHRQIELAPIPDEWFSPDLMPKALQYVTLDQQRWGMPMMQGNHLMLYYHKGWVSQPVTEWQQLDAITPALQAKGVIPVGWSYNEMYYFVTFLQTFGGHPVESGRITLDTPAMVQALEAYRTVASQHWTDPRADYDTALARFVSGKSAYFIDGDWAFNDLRKTLGDQFGVALLPRWQQRPMFSMSGAYVIGVSQWAMADERRRPAIKALLAFIQQEDIQRLLYQHGSLLPVSQRAFANIDKSASPYAGVLLEQFSLSSPMPSDSAMSIAWQAMEKGMERFKEGSSARAAARYMQQLADRQYQQVK